jgi:hypothetical protein
LATASHTANAMVSTLNARQVMRRPKMLLHGTMMKLA